MATCPLDLAEANSRPRVDKHPTQNKLRFEAALAQPASAMDTEV